MPPRFAFRMVYHEDCARFFEDGEIRSKNHAVGQPCHQTSYADIVARRNTHVIAMPNDKVINDHVAFYFSPITAMTYTIHKGNVRRVGPDGIDCGAATMDDRVFFVADPHRLAANGLRFHFSDIACNAVTPVPRFESDLAKLATHVSWDLFDESPIIARIPQIGYEGVTRFFMNADQPIRYQERSRKRMAEFLVEDAVPLDLFECIVTKTDSIKRSVERMMSASRFDVPVHAIPGCYF